MIRGKLKDIPFDAMGVVARKNILDYASVEERSTTNESLLSEAQLSMLTVQEANIYYRDFTITNKSNSIFNLSAQTLCSMDQTILLRVHTANFNSGNIRVDFYNKLVTGTQKSSLMDGFIWGHFNKMDSLTGFVENLSGSFVRNLTAQQLGLLSTSFVRKLYTSNPRRVDVTTLRDHVFRNMSIPSWRDLLNEMGDFRLQDDGRLSMRVLSGPTSGEYSVDHVNNHVRNNSIYFARMLLGEYQTLNEMSVWFNLKLKADYLNRLGSEAINQFNVSVFKVIDVSERELNKLNGSFFNNISDAKLNTLKGLNDAIVNTVLAKMPSLTLSKVKPFTDAPVILKPEEVLTFTLSTSTTNFTAGDVVVVGGTLSNFTGSGVSYTARLSVLPSVNAVTVSVAHGNFSSSNINNGAFRQVMSVDRISPIVSISSDRTMLSTYGTEVLTFSLSESVNGFTQDDVTVSLGGISGFTGSGVRYTALFSADLNTTGNATISVGSNAFFDSAGNGNISSNNFNMSVNTVVKERGVANLSISLDTGNDGDRITSAKRQTIKGDLVGEYQSGDKVKLSVDDDITWVDVDLLAESRINSDGRTYTQYYFEKVIDLQEGRHNISAKIVNGTTYSGSISNLSYELDTAFAPVDITSVAIDQDTGLSANDRVTRIKMQNISGELNRALARGEKLEIRVDGANWMTVSPSQITSKGDGRYGFVQSIGLAEGTHRIETRVIDQAGNTNYDPASLNHVSYTLDTTSPVVEIKSNNVGIVNMGKVAIITFTSSEALSIASSHMMLEQGYISDITGVGNSYTGVFVPYQGIEGSVNMNLSNSYSAFNMVIGDLAGNMAVSSTPLRLEVDTKSPKLEITSEKTNLKAGDTTILRFTSSEDITGFDASKIEVVGGVLSNFTGSGRFYSAYFVAGRTADGLALNNSALVRVASNQFVDKAGNKNLFSTLLSIDLHKMDIVASFDNVSIVRLEGRLWLSFVARFSEHISGLSEDCFNVVGGVVWSIGYGNISGNAYDVMVRLDSDAISEVKVNFNVSNIRNQHNMSVVTAQGAVGEIRESIMRFGLFVPGLVEQEIGQDVDVLVNLKNTGAEVGNKVRVSYVKRDGIRYYEEWDLTEENGFNTSEQYFFGKIPKSRLSGEALSQDSLKVELLVGETIVRESTRLNTNLQGVNSGYLADLLKQKASDISNVFLDSAIYVPGVIAQMPVSFFNTARIIDYIKMVNAVSVELIRQIPLNREGFSSAFILELTKRVLNNQSLVEILTTSQVAQLSLDTFNKIKLALGDIKDQNIRFSHLPIAFWNGLNAGGEDRIALLDASTLKEMLRVGDVALLGDNFLRGLHNKMFATGSELILTAGQMQRLSSTQLSVLFSGEGPLWQSKPISASILNSLSSQQVSQLSLDVFSSHIGITDIGELKESFWSGVTEEQLMSLSIDVIRALGGHIARLDSADAAKLISWVGLSFLTHNSDRSKSKLDAFFAGFVLDRKGVPYQILNSLNAEQVRNLSDEVIDFCLPDVSSESLNNLEVFLRLGVRSISKGVMILSSVQLNSLDENKLNAFLSAWVQANNGNGLLLPDYVVSQLRVEHMSKLEYSVVACCLPRTISENLLNALDVKVINMLPESWLQAIPLSTVAKLSARFIGAANLKEGISTVWIQAVSALAWSEVEPFVITNLAKGLRLDVNSVWTPNQVKEFSLAQLSSLLYGSVSYNRDNQPIFADLSTLFSSFSSGDNKLTGVSSYLLKQLIKDPRVRDRLGIATSKDLTGALLDDIAMYRTASTNEERTAKVDQIRIKLSNATQLEWQNLTAQVINDLSVEGIALGGSLSDTQKNVRTLIRNEFVNLNTSILPQLNVNVISDLALALYKATVEDNGGLNYGTDTFSFFTAAQIDQFLVKWDELVNAGGGNALNIFYVLHELDWNSQVKNLSGVGLNRPSILNHLHKYSAQFIYNFGLWVRDNASRESILMSEAMSLELRRFSSEQVASFALAWTGQATPETVPNSIRSLFSIDQWNNY
jgi:hypothetical protein